MSDHTQSETRVLVVEDDPYLRMSVITMIEAAGFDVLAASNADEAITILQEYDRIRIVFTDVDMPGSMNGIMLAIIVRWRWPPIEIIITSGRRRPPAGELPARGVFLSKPYDPDQLLETMKLMAA